MNDVPTPNLPLLRKILTHIDEHPEEWFQGSWRLDWRGISPSWHHELRRQAPHLVRIPQCGTSFCIAGHALAMTGELGPDGMGMPSSGGWGESARQVLGLTTYEADKLFWGGRTRQEIQEIAQEIAARAGEEL